MGSALSDRLDALILAGMPIPVKTMLLARGSALAIFFGGVLAGTSGLGILFFPSIVDLPNLGLRLFLAHLVAVLASRVFGLSCFIAARSLFLCVGSPRWSARIAPVFQMLCMLALFAALLLIPFSVHFLHPLLASSGVAAFWFPPFWFLGLYQWVLQGPNTMPLFRELGVLAVWASALTAALCVLLFPLAHQRRTAQVLEGGAPLTQRRRRLPVDALLSIFVRDPRALSVIRLIDQTLWRTPRTRVLLAAFSGVGGAAAAIALLLPSLSANMYSLRVTPAGVRLALAFLGVWTVISLRTTLHAAVAANGYWAFQTIEGSPKVAHLEAVHHWIATWSALVSLAALGMADAWLMRSGLRPDPVAAQSLCVVALPLLATDCFAGRDTSLPFSTPRPYSVYMISWVVFTYLVVLPTTVLVAARCERWMEGRLVRTALSLCAVTLAHSALRAWRLRSTASVEGLNTRACPWLQESLGCMTDRKPAQRRLQSTQRTTRSHMRSHTRLAASVFGRSSKGGLPGRFPSETLPGCSECDLRPKLENTRLSCSIGVR